MTVVTQFVTHDGTDDGDLVEVRRFYAQDGKVLPQPNATLGGGEGGAYDSITDSFCAAQKRAFNDSDGFAPRGGLKAVGDAVALA